MKLTDFMKAATKRERAAVAVACSGSVAYLYQIAGGHRFASPQLATEIEAKTRQVAADSEGRLEGVPRQSLVRHPEIFRGVCPREEKQSGNPGTAADVQAKPEPAEHGDSVV
jgi:hypothetical protein